MLHYQKGELGSVSISDLNGLHAVAVIRQAFTMWVEAENLPSVGRQIRNYVKNGDF